MKPEILLIQQVRSPCNFDVQYDCYSLYSNNLWTVEPQPLHSAQTVHVAYKELVRQWSRQVTQNWSFLFVLTHYVAEEK